MWLMIDECVLIVDYGYLMVDYGYLMVDSCVGLLIDG